MRHEEIYYTCNGCGTRLDPLARTEVKVTNTDPAAQVPTHDYDLCAPCWLKVYPILNGGEKIITNTSFDDVIDDLRPWDL